MKIIVPVHYEIDENFWYASVNHFEKETRVYQSIEGFGSIQESAINPATIIDVIVHSLPQTVDGVESGIFSFEAKLPWTCGEIIMENML